MKFLTPLLFIALSFAVVWLYLGPMYDDIRLEQAKHVVYEDYNTQAENLIKKEEDLRRKLTSISDHDRARLQTILPNELSSAELLLRLNQIARSLSLTLQEVSVTEEGEVDPRTQRSSSEIAEQKPYRKMTSSVSVTATYSQFLELMQRMESSIHFLDIRAIDINTPSESERLSGGYEFTLEFDSYVLK